jgi:tRNA G46 methylase TrmB
MHSPMSPAEMDWSSYYPAFVAETQPSETSHPWLKKDVEVVDIGCGFGGLLVALAPLMPETLMLGESPTMKPRCLRDILTRRRS